MDDGAVERLLGRCAEGERQALEQLYGLTSARLFGVLMHILRRRELAEDALQDVYVRVWQRAGQFDNYRGRATAWLVSIARYRAIDLLRGTRTLLPIDDAQGEARIELTSEPEAPPESTRTRAALERCLGLLNDTQRRCVTLAFVNGLSHDEIALTVGSPLGTIKSWVRRGLISLRQCLEA
jgi:RNA polymerase sigma-70 factor (ECF subfamily)